MDTTSFKAVLVLCLKYVCIMEITWAAMTAKEGITEKSSWPSYKYFKSEVSLWVRVQPTVGENHRVKVIVSLTSANLLAQYGIIFAYFPMHREWRHVECRRKVQTLTCQWQRKYPQTHPHYLKNQDISPLDNSRVIDNVLHVAILHWGNQTLKDWTTETNSLMTLELVG